MKVRFLRDKQLPPIQFLRGEEQVFPALLAQQLIASGDAIAMPAPETAVRTPQRETAVAGRGRETATRTPQRETAVLNRTPKK